MDGLMDVWMDWWMYEWIDGCMDELMDEWMDGYIVIGKDRKWIVKETSKQLWRRIKKGKNQVC